VNGSGISWAIGKSAPRSRQITTPVPHHSVFTGRMPFLPPNQQRQSTEGKSTEGKVMKQLIRFQLLTWSVAWVHLPHDISPGECTRVSSVCRIMVRVGFMVIVQSDVWSRVTQ